MHSHTAHMPQPTMYSTVANLQQVAKLACIMLRNVTPLITKVQCSNHLATVMGKS